MARCDTYAPGNCTFGACADNPWLPEGLGDGGDWAANAAGRGYTVVAQPVVGSVVSYCRGDGYSPFGHCASVVRVAPDGRFEVHEMNFVALDTWDYRWSTDQDVCGFILPPAGTQGRGAALAGPGGAGTTWGIPAQPVAAWEAIRGWTRDTGAALYAAGVALINAADAIGA